MNANDHAIVVGIQTYPGIGDLDGPCHDAERFRDWLLSSTGGHLDLGNVDVSLTTNYPAPNGVADARPVLDDLHQMLRPHVQRASQHRHVPGRLFVYVAGHGFGDSQSIDAAALYVANAETLFPLHLAVTSYAEWFRRNWAFEEIIVIMDCCRTANPLHAVSPPALPQTNTHPNARKVKTFYAFATGWGQLARERERGGVTSGIFTDALLEALTHAQPNRLGRVTGSTVRDYVHNVIDDVAGGVSVDPPDIKLDERRDVLFVERRTAAGLLISFTASDTRRGQELVIVDGAFEEVHRDVIPPGEFSVMLSPGFYKAVVPDAAYERLFEVPTHEAISL